MAKERTTQIAVRVPDSLLADMDKLCESEACTRAEFVRMCVADTLAATRMVKRTLFGAGTVEEVKGLLRDVFAEMERSKAKQPGLVVAAGPKGKRKRSRGSTRKK